MRLPEEITAKLQRRFQLDYPDWARGRGHWPLRVNLQPPMMHERSENPVGCHQWADRWHSYGGPGFVEYTNVRFPTGTHPMPQRLTFATPGELAALAPETQDTWRRCGLRLTELERLFPRARFERFVRRVTDLEEQDFRRLISTTKWVAENPTSGMLLRQLPIEGIDTKWLVRHAALLLSLLASDTTEDEIEMATEESQSQRMQLHRRLGLRVPPDLVQVGILDPALREQVAGMRYIAAGTEDLNKWRHVPHTVIILENKETGYAITDDWVGTVVLHGLGFSVAHYGRINWVRSAAKVIYWGDIDLPGLAFVSDLRRLGVQAETVLMNMETLNRFRRLAVEGATPTRQDIPHLTSPERELYEHLREYAATHGVGLLLEQERIAWEHAYMALASAYRS